MKTKQLLCALILIWLMLTFQVHDSSAAKAGIIPQDSAAKEFDRGQKSKFSTAGHPKAKGLSITIEYPKSWQAAEGERPNVVQKFISGDGASAGTSMILIKTLPSNISLSQQDINEMFATSSLREAIPNGSRFIAGNRTKMDGLPGAWMSYAQEQERAGAKLRRYTLAFMFYFEKKIITLDCSVGGLASEPSKEQEKRFQAMVPLFQLMANSIVVQDRYK